MRQLEAPIHKSIVQYLRATLPHGWVVQSTPNKPRSKIAGAQEKRMGAVKGWPDIAIYGNAEEAGELVRTVTYFLEVKAPKGRVADAQHEIHDRLQDLGFPVGVVRSVDDVRALVREWRLPSKDAAVNDNQNTWISLGDAANAVVNKARGSV